MKKRIIQLITCLCLFFSMGVVFASNTVDINGKEYTYTNSSKVVEPKVIETIEILESGVTQYKYHFSFKNESENDIKNFIESEILPKYNINKNVTLEKVPGESINGHIVEYSYEYQNRKEDKLCTEFDLIIYPNENVNLNGNSIMDTTLPDYANNGYNIKVMNSNNHTSVIDSLVGPANVEVQHWQTGPNEKTIQQFWRPVFATDIAIKNAVWTIEFPNFTPDEVNSMALQDVSDWLVTRYYPNVSTKSDYQSYNKLTGKNLLSQYTVEGNKIIFNLGDIPEHTAMSISANIKFPTARDLSANKVEVNTHISGTWDSTILPTTSTSTPYKLDESSYTIDCKECILGNVLIVKVDSENNQPLKDVTFEIYDSEGEKVGENLTDEDGEILFKDLPYGEYTVKETSTLEGYILDSKEYKVSIVENNKVVTLNISNEKIKETPVETTDETINETDKETTIETINETDKETDKQTISETNEETSSETIKETDKEIKNETKEKPIINDNNHNNTNNPNTGDNFNTIYYLGALSIALIALVILNKHQNTNKQ